MGQERERGASNRPRAADEWHSEGPTRVCRARVLQVILGVIDFIRPDKWILRYVVAPRQSTQAEMNASYALDSETYLPFRYQLVLKVVCITFAFSPAIPLLLPIAALFMYASYWCVGGNERHDASCPM